MKLVRFGPPGKERPGIVIENKIYDASSVAGDYNESFFESDGLLRLHHWIEDNKGHLPQAPEGVRLGSPIARPSKIVCTGLNYRDHAHEMTQELPVEPIIFLKATSAISGPYDNIIIPKNSVKTDWEVELGVVISRRASYVREQEAMDYVAGYILHNDISEREFQLERNGTWDKGKGCDSFAPLGPYLVTKDEIPDPQNLRLWLKVNGQPMQDANTAQMIFPIPYVISYISQFMTLLPGDMISTGSPSGVGKGLKPHPVYLKPGDVVELGIEGLGSSRQVVKVHE